ncbi:AI-2E family transporter [Actinocorallia populi]|uniref:AI-2E family transporter n=1 Tax=Actinocorallia populi TaxID=2079200 RepID=UPI001300B713|nr:AI-2E family transporter [Actinocorallia populi]
MDVEAGLRRRTLKAGHRLLVVVLATLAVWAVWQVRTVAIPVLVAVFIASATVPPAHWLMRRGMHPAPATTVVWLGLVAAAALLVTLLIPVTVAGIDDLTFNLDRFVARLQGTAVRFGVDEARFTDLGDQARQWLSEQSGRIAGGALTGVIATGEILIGAVLALVLAIYFTHGGPNLLVWLTELLPESSREETRTGASIVFHVVGRYMRGVALVGFVDGFFIGIGLLLLGVPLAIPLAMLTWIGAFLPIVGAFLAGLLAAVVAFIAKGWIAALAVVALTIAVQQIEGHVLAPQIYGRALDLPGPVILIAIALGSTLAGIAGAFLAAPVTSAVVALLHHRAEVRERPAQKNLGTSGIESG